MINRYRPIGIVFAAALGLAACSNTISNQPATSVLPSGTVADLQAAEWNLDQAISIGVLPSTDPADKCLHDELGGAGLDPTVTPAPTAKSFTAKNQGLASAGSILYIKAQQAQSAAATAKADDASCEALVGKIVIDAVKAGASVGVTVFGAL